MSVSVRNAIDMQTGERVTIIHRTTGYFEDGIWVEGRPKRIKAIASVQVPSQEELLMHTGLERVKEMRSFYINKHVEAEDSFKEGDADHIEWKGETYKIMAVEEWGSYGYTKAIGARQS